jgi:hypothetical protein
MLQDVSLYYKNGQIVSDSGLVFASALLPTQTGTLLAVTQYAPGSQTSITMTGTTTPAASMAAWDSTNINTGNFTAPSSGKVLVEVGFSAKASAAANSCVIGLCEHGTITPMVGVTSTLQVGAGNSVQSYSHRQLITGLTPGSTHNFDFMGACFTNTATFILVAMGLTGTLTLVTAGGPVVMAVTAV